MSTKKRSSVRQPATPSAPSVPAVPLFSPAPLPALSGSATLKHGNSSPQYPAPSLAPPESGSVTVRKEKRRAETRQIHIRPVEEQHNRSPTTVMQFASGQSSSGPPTGSRELTAEEQAIIPLLGNSINLVYLLLDKCKAQEVFDSVPPEDQGHRVTIHPINFRQSIVKWAASVEEYQTIESMLPVLYRRRFHDSSGYLSQDADPTPAKVKQCVGHQQGERDRTSNRDLEDPSAFRSAEDSRSALKDLPRDLQINRTQPAASLQDSAAVSDHDAPRVARNKNAPIGHDVPPSTVLCQSNSQADPSQASAQDDIPSVDHGIGASPELVLRPVDDALPTTNVCAETNVAQRTQRSRSLWHTVQLAAAGLALAMTSAALGGMFVWAILAFETFDMSFFIKFLLVPIKLGLLWALPWMIRRLYCLGRNLGVVAGYVGLLCRIICKGLGRGAAGTFRIALELMISCLGWLYDRAVAFSGVEL